MLGYDEPSDEDFDEEVDEPEDDDQSDVSAVEVDEDADEERLGDFGPSKSDYYNTDVIQTEEEALEEEREARRLQQKQLEDMTEADFGLDEGQWLDEAEDDGKGQKTVTEKLPEPTIAEDASVEERLMFLKTRYPEFEPLAKDFLGLQALHKRLASAAESVEKGLKVSNLSSRKRKLDKIDEESPPIPVALTQFRALSAYLGTIGVYLALLTSSFNSKSGLAMAPTELRDHPAIKSIVQCRQRWEAIKDVPIPDSENTAIYHPVETEAEETRTALAPSKEKKQRRKKKSRAERNALEAEKAEAVAREARIAAAEASLADLDNVIAPTRTKMSKASTELARPGDDASDFGDEAPLTAEEAAAKAQRKKSLRFYTSQIAQKANKRGTASRDAGGDTDIPHKERIRDRQERLNREASKRGQAGVDLNDDDGSSDEEPTNAERKAAADGDSDDDTYYQTITSRTASKKAAKAAQAATAASTTSLTNNPSSFNDASTSDTKRGITREILKNKGLGPNRKSKTLTPRVKGKKKFEKKMQKLRGSGQRKVYDGDARGRAGGYGGERTGINMGVVRSVKL